MKLKTKKIISLSVISASLLGAVIFGYLAFNRGAGGLSGGGSSNVVQPATSSVLPQGKSLNFEKLEEFNPNGKIFPYPVVEETEVGLPESQLVVPNSEVRDTNPQPEQLPEEAPETN